MSLLAGIIIFVCLGVGGYYQFFTNEIDAPAEQIAEEMLEKYNIDEDFSADKKRILEKESLQPDVAVPEKSDSATSVAVTPVTTKKDE